MSRHAPSSGPWEHMPRRRSKTLTGFCWITGVLVSSGLAIALAGKALPKTAATVLQSEQRAWMGEW